MHLGNKTKLSAGMIHVNEYPRNRLGNNYIKWTKISRKVENKIKQFEEQKSMNSSKQLAIFMHVIA